MNRLIKKEIRLLKLRRDKLIAAACRAECTSELRLTRALAKLEKQISKLRDAHAREAFLSDRALEKTTTKIDRRLAILTARLTT